MHCIAKVLVILGRHQWLGNFLLLPMSNQQVSGNLWLSFETGQCLKILVKWVSVFSTFGIPIRILAKTLYCSNQTCSMVYGHAFVLILRQRSIIQWAGEHAFCQDWTLIPPPPPILSASMSVWLVKTQLKAEGHGQVWHRFLCKWREGVQITSPLRPCRCHSRGSFPHLASVRNNSGIFPENFRKIFGKFRTFSVTSSAHYL